MCKIIQSCGFEKMMEELRNIFKLSSGSTSWCSVSTPISFKEMLVHLYHSTPSKWWKNVCFSKKSPIIRPLNSCFLSRMIIPPPPAHAMGCTTHSFARAHIALNRSCIGLQLRYQPSNVPRPFQDFLWSKHGTTGMVTFQLHPGKRTNVLYF